MITICSASQAYEIIAGGEVDACISISSPPGSMWATRPKNLHLVPEVHQLTIDDLSDRPSPYAPNAELLKQIIEILKKHESAFTETKPHLLIHCFAGQQRSTAVGYLGFALALGPGKEAEALDLAERCSLNRSSFYPNFTIVEIADAALSRNGALLKAL